MSSVENGPDQIITTPADIDHSRYRVVVGPIRHIRRPSHEIGEVRVVGADSLSTAHSWLQEHLKGYLEPDHRARADGARAAIIEVDRANATTGLVSSLYGPTAAVLGQVSELVTAQSRALLPDFSRPYRARLYNDEDLVTFESEPFQAEATARQWLQERGERGPMDGVQASITRLDPTLGWPRPVFEFAVQRPDFGANLCNSLIDIEDADDAFLARVQPGSPSVLTAYQNTEHALQAQTSASDLFGETVYRDRLADRLRSTQIVNHPAETDSHPAMFALRDLYRIRRDNPAHTTWDTSIVSAARREADRVMTQRRVFRFHDRRDASRLIEVLWTGSAVPLHRRGWFATEHRHTPEGTTFVAILGRQTTGRAMLHMLTDRMPAFSTTTPVLRPAVDIPREHDHEILDLDYLHSSLTEQVHKLTRQSDTLRRPFAVHKTGQATTIESVRGEGRDYPPDRVFDFWRDGLFPGSRTGAITYNPFTWHNDPHEQGMVPTAGRPGEHSPERATATDPVPHTEPGERIAGLIEIARAQQPPEHRTAPETTPHAMPAALEHERDPTIDHELD